MNPWLILIPAFVCFAIGAGISYTDSIRKSQWFIPAYFSVGFVGMVCWVWACRLIDDKQKLYLFSLAWDFLMVVCYYALPLLIFEFKFNKGVIIGMLIMLVGLVIVKVYGN